MAILQDPRTRGLFIECNLFQIPRECVHSMEEGLRRCYFSKSTGRKFPGISDGFLTDASRRDTRPVYTRAEEQTALTPEQTRDSTILRIDVTKLRGTDNARKILGSNEEAVNVLTEFIRNNFELTKSN
ncbi:hypothetical protein WN55_00748 [Dufourea novaeangliae]|uniref:Uncharacterized protein n=1 Tax=Dufourea novaeangliae TaxID=178035 RepID=A0A154PD14_DUFNO|nr:hypothetical protein WN55_00748 [Dufourea novaeangliae]